VERRKKTTSTPMVISYTGKGEESCLSLSKLFIVYGNNIGVQKLEYKHDYVLTGNLLVDKQTTDWHEWDTMQGLDYPEETKYYDGVEFIGSDMTYTCPATEKLYIYSFGGGGGFNFNASDYADFGMGESGELDELVLNVVAGDILTITVGLGGDNKLDGQAPKAGTTTTILRNGTLVSSAQGGGIGTLGSNTYTPIHTRHFHSPNVGGVQYRTIFNSIWRKTWIGTRDHFEYDSIADKVVCGRAYTIRLSGMHPYNHVGRGGLSMVQSNGDIEDATTPKDGGVIIVRENRC